MKRFLRSGRRLASLTALVVASLLAPASLASAATSPSTGSYSLSLPTVGLLQAGGAATVLGVRVTCPRAAGDVFVEGELTQASSGSVGAQWTGDPFEPCTGSAQTVTVLVTSRDPTIQVFRAAQAHLSLSVSFFNNSRSISRTGNVALQNQPVNNPAVHGITRLANGAALAVDATIPCTANGQISVYGSVSQRISSNTVQAALIRQGVVCHKPAVVVSLYASPPAVPWSTQPAVTSVENVCIVDCVYIGLISSRPVTS